MKILLRRYDGNCYVWKDAEYKNDMFYLLGSNTRIRQYDILAIKDHDLEGKVQCKFCGAILKNDPEVIEQHFAEEEAKKNCLECRDMREGTARLRKNEYKKNADGTYQVIATYNTQLSCHYNYLGMLIDSATAKERCKFNQHRLQGVRPYGGILIQYPDLFEKQITVDLLNKKGYAFKQFSSDHLYYDMKCRNTLAACVNENGIVDHFETWNKYDYWMVYYSATQKKLLFKVPTGYSEVKPYTMSDTTYTTIKKKIESLYEEA